MPAGDPPRWITIRTPFNYSWPGRAAITHYKEPGEFMVKGEVADFAVGQGFATEGKLDGSEARSSKGRRTSRRTGKGKTAKPKADAAAPDTRSDANVAGEDLAPDDRAEARSAVDSDAE